MWGIVPFLEHPDLTTVGLGAVMGGQLHCRRPIDDDDDDDVPFVYRSLCIEHACLWPLLLLRGKILPKKINVRIEHVKHSKSRDGFLQRVKQNEKKKIDAKANGTWVELKRQVYRSTKNLH